MNRDAFVWSGQRKEGRKVYLSGVHFLVGEGAVKSPAGAWVSAAS